MKSVASISSIAVACAAGLLSVSFIAAPAQAATMKECAAQWKTMKDAKQTDGKTYKDFSKTCMSGSSDAAKADTAKPAEAPKPAAAAAKPAETAKKADTPAKADTADKKDAKPSDARAAAIARERECGAEWKADKAAGKVAAGMKWPQYWSACSKRKKGEG